MTANTTHDVIASVIDKSTNDIFTIRMETSNGGFHYGAFVGAFVQLDVFAGVPSEDGWFDRHIKIDDAADGVLEHYYVGESDFDWSTIFRTPDGYIYVFGTYEREGFNDWNPTFKLNCIGRCINKRFSVGPFSQIICKSFACTYRNTYNFTVELYQNSFIAYVAERTVDRTKFVKD